LHRAIHVPEGVQINGHCFRRILRQELRHGVRDFFLRRRWRKYVYRSVVAVFDLYRVEKITEHLLVGPEQPGLQKVTRERIAYAATERRLHPGMSFGGWFSLDEDASQMALIRQSLDGRFVDRLLFRLQKSENLDRERWRHPLENFV